MENHKFTLLPFAILRHNRVVRWKKAISGDQFTRVAMLRKHCFILDLSRHFFKDLSLITRFRMACCRKGCPFILIIHINRNGLQINNVSIILFTKWLYGTFHQFMLGSLRLRFGLRTSLYLNRGQLNGSLLPIYCSYFTRRQRFSGSTTGPLSRHHLPYRTRFESPF